MNGRKASEGQSVWGLSMFHHRLPFLLLSICSSHAVNCSMYSLLHNTMDCGASCWPDPHVAVGGRPLDKVGPYLVPATDTSPVGLCALEFR